MLQILDSDRVPLSLFFVFIVFSLFFGDVA